MGTLYILHYLDREDMRHEYKFGAASDKLAWSKARLHLKYLNEDEESFYHDPKLYKIGTEVEEI
jgi:hypothetical protein